MATLTHAKLKELLNYDPITGLFVWNVDRNQKVLAGSQAGRIEGHGYLEIVINRVRFRAQRLAWFYMTGQWPIDQVDHKNNIRLDNSWDNLRAANQGENQCNLGPRSNNKLGIKNIFKTKNGYRVEIKKNKVATSKAFANLDEAIVWRDIKLNELHGVFARLQ
jgi:hypothetical protein